MIYLATNPRWRTGGVVYHAASAQGQQIALPTSALCQRADVGTLITPAGGNRVATLTEWCCAWAADTGCFAQPEAFDVGHYLEWLERLRPIQDRCLFATAPDVVGDAHTTLERSAPVLPMLRARGWPPALVAQDGLERLEVPWDSFTALFLGGTTSWKLGEAAAALAAEARQRGKHIHMGRVNSRRRVRHAQVLGCHSVDGTCITFDPPTYVRVIPRWLDGLPLRLPLTALAPLLN